MVVATTVLYVAMVYAEHKKAESRVISFSSNAPKFCIAVSGPGAPLMPASDIEKVIRDDFSTIPEVQRVEFTRENGELLVRIAVTNPRKDIRYKIYDKQAALIGAFPDVDLDFSLLPMD